MPRLASAAGHFDDEPGEFVLPYRSVRTADDPDATLLEFLESADAAAADLGEWDRTRLEADAAVGPTDNDPA